MSASGYTPILIYGSTTTGATPDAANLTTNASGVELAVNAYDGKLFYKDNLGAVQILATKSAAQNSISFGTTGLTPSTATQGAVTVAGTLITSNGGTGLSSWTAGDLPYYASGTALSKLGIGTAGQILTSNGTSPQWSAPPSTGVTTFSAGTTGLTPSTATSGAVTLAGILAVANGGTGVGSSGGVPAGGFYVPNSVSPPQFGTLPVSVGGTGATTLTANNVILGNGTSAVQVVAPGTSGNVLTSNGTTWVSTAPAAQSYPGAGIAVSTGSAWTTSKTAPSGAIVGDTDTQTLTNKTFTGYTETVYTLSGTDINPANGTVQTKTLGANTTFTESIADGQSVVLMVNPVTYTVTWPTLTWINTAGSGSAPTLKASATNTVVLWQVGGTLYGNWVGSN